MTPRVSVVIPTRDRLTTLPRALASVDAQSFRDFEVVVVDDGSLDGTSGWIRAERPDVALVAAAEPVGAASARNLGLGRACGELIAFLDDDDVWDPAYLEAQVAHLDSHPEATVSYADHVEVNPAGRKSQPDPRPLLANAGPLLRLLAESFVHTMSVVVCRRAAFERFGLLDESLLVVHDVDWYARVLNGGGSIVNLARPLVVRSVPGGLVIAHRQWYREELDVNARALAAGGEAWHDRRLIAVYRSLYFARLALGRGDVTFGLARLTGAFRRSPRWTLWLAAAGLRRRARPRQTLAVSAKAAS